MSKANETQVGGDHYKKKAVQHWDFVGINQHSYLGGQVSKYLCRWKDKGGTQDVEKAAHFLDKLIELNEEPEIVRVQLDDFLAAQDVGVLERSIIALVHAYETDGNIEFLRVAKKIMDDLVADVTDF